MKILTYEDITGAVDPRWLTELTDITEHSGITKLDTLPVTGALKKALDEWDGLTDLIHLFITHVPDTSTTRLFIASDASGRFKNYCENVLEDAGWGCCLSESVAIDYAPAHGKLATQIHESLHLFGVDDCYVDRTHEPKHSCSVDTCLMRCGVISTSVCESVNLQLKRLARS